MRKITPALLLLAGVLLFGCVQGGVEATATPTVQASATPNPFGTPHPTITPRPTPTPASANSVNSTQNSATSTPNPVPYGACSLNNSCYDRVQGSIFPCDASTAYDYSGNYTCTCLQDCSVNANFTFNAAVSQQWKIQNGVCTGVPNYCNGLFPGSIFICNSDGTYNGSANHSCSCESNCSVNLTSWNNSTCPTTSACNGLNPGVSFPCNSLGNYQSPGSYTCTCNSDCTVNSTINPTVNGLCVIRNNCLNRAPGANYSCNSNGAYWPNGALNCTCNANCSVSVGA